MPRIGAKSVLLAYCAVLATLPVVQPNMSAAEPATKAATARPPAQPVTMVCVDADAKPVKGAEVYLFQYNGAAKQYQQFGPFQSDEQGQAVCAEAAFTDDLGNFDRWIYARIPGRLVGVARTTKFTNHKVSNPELQVKLQACCSVKGQVTVPEGFDATKVAVRVRTLHVVTGPGFFDYGSFPREDSFPGLDTALPKIFECRPDSEGRFQFDDVPQRGRLYLVTAADGLAEAQWWNGVGANNQPNPLDEARIELTIPQASTLSGRLLTPDGKPAADIKVAARLSPSAARRVAYLSTFRAVTDDKGDFKLGGLPQIEFVLSIEDPKKRWTLRPLENNLLRPGEDEHLTYNLEAGVVVSGRVLDTDGKPVTGASFSAITDSQNGHGLDHAMTDTKGRYQFRLPSGGARLYFDSLPDGFAYPDPQIVKELDIKSGQADIENLDFTLPRQSP